jgi:hypothetical protein
MPIHSQMIKFALNDSIYESNKRYESNYEKLSAFAQKIPSRSNRELSRVRLQVEQEKFSQIADDQERLQLTLPELKKTQERFESLAPEEKNVLDKRLANKNGEFKLVLQRRDGQLLAQTA